MNMDSNLPSSIAKEYENAEEERHDPMIVVFGRPGAGKSTIAEAASKLANLEYNKNKNESILWIDLDICIPQWMKDNFALGIYPSSKQRIDFAEHACDYVQNELQNSFSAVVGCIVSFSFVNVDLRDVYRRRFPTAHWMLVDVTQEEAMDRMTKRLDHFYKGKQPHDQNNDNNDHTNPHHNQSKQNEPSTTNHDHDHETTTMATTKDNSEWNFAPVTFQHTILDGMEPVNVNAKLLVEKLHSMIHSSTHISESK